MPSITITASNTLTGDLVLSDHGITIASRAQKVTWIVGPHSGVSAIVAISAKPGSANVFNPLPRQLGNSANWQGTINPGLQLPAEELYDIFWTDNNHITHQFDPKIQVKS
jgi:hypothetical protein